MKMKKNYAVAVAVLIFSAFGLIASIKMSRYARDYMPDLELRVSNLEGQASYLQRHSLDKSALIKMNRSARDKMTDLRTRVSNLEGQIKYLQRHSLDRGAIIKSLEGQVKYLQRHSLDRGAIQ